MPTYSRSRRMVLRSPEGAKKFRALIDEVNAAEVERDSALTSIGTKDRETWELAPGVLVHYAFDTRSNLPYVAVAGEDEAQALKYTRLLKSYFSPFTPEELLDSVAAAQTPRARAIAVSMVGLGAPDEFDENFFDAVRTAMADDDYRVRVAAVLAVDHSFWQEYLSPLMALAESEQEPLLRDEARIRAEHLRTNRTTDPGAER